MSDMFSSPWSLTSYHGHHIDPTHQWTDRQTKPDYKAPSLAEQERCHGQGFEAFNGSWPLVTGHHHYFTFTSLPLKREWIRTESREYKGRDLADARHSQMWGDSSPSLTQFHGLQPEIIPQIRLDTKFVAGLTNNHQRQCQLSCMGCCYH